MGTFDTSKERMKRTQALSIMWKLPFFRVSARVRKKLTLPYYIRTDGNSQIGPPTRHTADPLGKGD